MKERVLAFLGGSVIGLAFAALAYFTLMMA